MTDKKLQSYGRIIDVKFDDCCNHFVSLITVDCDSQLVQIT